MKRSIQRTLIHRTLLSFLICGTVSICAEDPKKPTFSPQTIKKTKLYSKALGLSTITLVSSYAACDTLFHLADIVEKPNSSDGGKWWYLAQWSIFLGTAVYGTTKIGQIAYQSLKEAFPDFFPKDTTAIETDSIFRSPQKDKESNSPKPPSE